MKFFYYVCHIYIEIPLWKTGEEIKIKAKKVTKLVPGKALKNAAK